jgi:ribonuclease HI
VSLNEYVAHFDGAARPNPGPASWGAVIRKGGKLVTSDNAKIGLSTNNVAELSGLLWVLEWLSSHPEARPARIYGDSMLSVRLARGEWKPKKPHLKPLVGRCRALLKRCGDTVTLDWVPREQNMEADEESHGCEEVEGTGAFCSDMTPRMARHA